MNMNILEFGNLMRTEVMDYLGEGVDIEFKEITKNNGIVHHALVIQKKHGCVAPTIYIDDMFVQYKGGKVLYSLVNDIVRIYKEYTPGENIDLDFFSDFSKVSGTLFFKLVNYEKNESILKDVPYIRFEDLALIPACKVKNKALGEGSITIKNDHMKIWEISKEELWENIYESCNNVATMTFKSMLSIVGDNGNFSGESETFDNMIVLSTESGMYGAASFLYPGVLKTISKTLGGGNLVIMCMR